MSGILLIDAEQPFATQMVEALQARGLFVQHLDEGKDALDYARAHRPDLIVLCAELKQTRGWPVCKMLKKDDELKSIPVIITSAEATAETFEQHRKLKARAEDYLHKPFDAHTLLERVGNFIALPQAGAPMVEATTVTAGEANDPFGDLDFEESQELMLDDNVLADLQIESELDVEASFDELNETTQNFDLNQNPHMPPVPMESMPYGAVVSSGPGEPPVMDPFGGSTGGHPLVDPQAFGFVPTASELSHPPAFPVPQEIVSADVLSVPSVPDAPFFTPQPAPSFADPHAVLHADPAGVVATAVTINPVEAAPAPDPLSMPDDEFDADIEAELEKMELDDADDLSADFDLEELDAPMSSDFTLDDADLDLSELPVDEPEAYGAAAPAQQVPMDVSQAAGEPILDAEMGDLGAVAPTPTPTPMPTPAPTPAAFLGETPASMRATRQMPAYAAPAAPLAAHFAAQPAPSPAAAVQDVPSPMWGSSSAATDIGSAQSMYAPVSMGSPGAAPVDAMSSVTSGAPVTNGVHASTHELQQMNALRHENTELKSHMVALQTRLQAAESTAQSAQEQLTARQESSSSSAREVLQLKEQLRSKDHELERMKDDVFEFEKKSVEVQEQLDGVRQELMGHARVVNEKDVQLAALHAKVSALEEERNVLEQTVNQRLAQAEQDRDQLQQHIADLSAAHESILQQFEVLRADHHAKEAELAQIRQRLQDEADLRVRAKQATELAMKLLSSQGGEGLSAQLAQLDM